jgi:serine/threonine protein kinase/tetratricopeptide (TPR) repeat protein
VKPPLDDVAGAILDDEPVDWDIVESRAGLADRAVIEQLKTLKALRLATRRTEPPAAAAATAWGHLHVLELIGRGSFGEVYRAWDSRLDREVALKLLPAERAGGDAPATGIIEEGRLVARVRHPNVVTIYGAERIDGQVGLWMELVKGRSLEEALRAGRRWSPPQVRRIGVELCRAVTAVHSARLLHRDIKTHNIMLADDGRVVLMDFGAGGDLVAGVDTNSTGTPLYVAPEVLAGRAATVLSDVYSIGVVLYHLLTGSYPVQGRDLADLRRAHAERSHGELAATGRNLPPRLRQVIARTLDPDPDCRYPSAEALGSALSALERVPAAVRAAYVSITLAVVVAVAVVASPPRGSPVPTDGDTGTPAESRESATAIAVMPFKNLSAEPDSDYFVDGLTTEVIRGLARIDGLQVRSQTSSFMFKDKPRDLDVIVARLRVAFVIEGDVLRVGNRLRVTAQFVRTADDVPVWSERFDRNVDDVFDIQDEISRAIVNNLRLTLNRGQRQYRTSLAAYETYLRARSLVGRRGTESARQAARLFEQVIALDPAMTPAHAGLVDAYAEMAWQIEGGNSLDWALDRMRPAAARALELDPLLAEAHAAMGITAARDRDWTNAAASFERAIALNPILTHIQATYSQTVLVPTGQLRKAQQLLRAAARMDPLSPALRRELAWALFADRRFDEAAALFREALAIDPGLPFATQGLARALTFAGRPVEAIAVWEGRPASDGNWERWLMHAYVRAGRRADTERLVEAHRTEHPYRQAIIYSALGDKDGTFEALARAAEILPHRTALLLVLPEMALLRDDPRLETVRTALDLR